MTDEMILRSDDLDDLRAPVPPCAFDVSDPHLPMWRIAMRNRGIADPRDAGGFGLDTGFLLACADFQRRLGIDVLGDLVAWRLGSSVAHLHARGTAYVATEDTGRGARHLGYVEAIR